MPYFYKLSEMVDGLGRKDYAWLAAVGRVFSDFSVGCYKLTHSSNMSFILFEFDEDDVDKHNPYLTPYEYRSIGGKAITFDKIFNGPPAIIFKENSFIGGMNPRFTERAAKKFFDHISRISETYPIFDSLYIHITCEENIESISKIGLLADDSIDDQYRIGDREQSDDDIVASLQEYHASNTPLEKAKEHYAANRDKINMRARARYAENRDKINKRVRDRNAENRDTLNKRARDRHAAKKLAVS